MYNESPLYRVEKNTNKERINLINTQSLSMETTTIYITIYANTDKLKSAAKIKICSLNTLKTCKNVSPDYVASIYLIESLPQVLSESRKKSERHSSFKFLYVRNKI